MNIGFDLDNTLIDLDPNKELIKRLNYHSSKSDVHDWEYSTFPEHIRKEVFNLFKDESFMCGETIIPFPNVQNKIKELTNKGYNIVLITARAENLTEGTIKLVNKYFPEIKDINLVGFNVSKKDLFIEKKLDLWIDDSPHGVKDSLDLKIKTYLISNEHTKYNWIVRDIVNPHIYECVSKIEI